METRPIPIPFVSPVVGISNYQDAAAETTEGEMVVITPEPDNPYDANACRVDTRDGQHLGYIPATLAARLCARSEPGWEGRIVARYDSHLTIGLRIEVSTTLERAEAVIAAKHTETAAPAAEEAGTDRPVTARHSHRVLGTFAGRDEVMVFVSKGGSIIRYPADLVDVH